MNSLIDHTCRRFLLGIASEEEESRIEMAILDGELDESFLRDAEDGLIDDYLLSRLTPEERRAFTVNFLSTEDRSERIEFAAALVAYAQKQPAQVRSASLIAELHQSILSILSWRRTALLAAAASALLAVIVGVQQFRIHREQQIASDARNELIRLQAKLDSGNAATARQGDGSTTSSGSLQIQDSGIPVIDFASSTRGVYPVRLRIGVRTRFVQIAVKLPSASVMKYRLTLVSPNGDQLWMQEFPASTIPLAKESTVVLPTSLLPPGIYHLRLETPSSGERMEMSGDCVLRVEMDES